MDMVIDTITIVLLAIGSFFALTGAVGLLRMPDFFSRLHPAGKSDSMAQLCFLMGLLAQTLHGLLAGDWTGAPDAAKLLFISLFLFLTTPVSTHAITQAAHVVGLEPWTAPGTSAEIMRAPAASQDSAEASEESSREAGKETGEETAKKSEGKPADGEATGEEAS